MKAHNGRMVKILRAIGGKKDKGALKSAIVGWSIRELGVSGASVRNYLADAMDAVYIEDRSGFLFLTPDGEDFLAKAGS